MSLPDNAELVAQRYAALPNADKNQYQAQYIWLGGKHELRCKTRTLDVK
jgi:hypothetical protein